MQVLMICSVFITLGSLHRGLKLMFAQRVRTADSRGLVECSPSKFRNIMA